LFNYVVKYGKIHIGGENVSSKNFKDLVARFKSLPPDEREYRRSGIDRRKGLRRTEEASRDASADKKEQQDDTSWKFQMDIDQRTEDRRSGIERRKG